MNAEHDHFVHIFYNINTSGTYSLYNRHTYMQSIIVEKNTIERKIENA